MNIKEILENYKTICVYGMSGTPGKPARQIPLYMAASGYNVIPVNPYLDEISGIKVFHNLMEVPDKIEILNVFRPSRDCLKVTEEALERKAIKGDIEVIWLQTGIVNEEARILAEKNGVTFIQDMCIYVEHRSL